MLVRTRLFFSTDRRRSTRSTPPTHCASSPRVYLQFGVELRMVLSMFLHHFEIEQVRGRAEMQEVLHFPWTSERTPVLLCLRAPAVFCANGCAGGRALPVWARLKAQAAACSAAVAKASGQSCSGHGTGAPASSKRRNTAA